MPKYTKTVLTLLVILLNTLSNFAQEEKVLFVEENPKYRQHQPRHVLDKITYTEKYIIFKFSYLCNWDNCGCYFFGTKNWEKWFLQDVKTQKKYNFVEIRNIRKNNKLLIEKITEKDAFVNGLVKDEKASCEIYFEHLPREVKKVDLIEGSREDNLNFHCFEIEVKPFKRKRQEAEAE